MITMARTRSTTSIDTELNKIQEELEKLQEKEESLKARQLELQQLKQEQVTKQIMEACQKSGKSLQELLTFLDV